MTVRSLAITSRGRGGGRRLVARKVTYGLDLDNVYGRLVARVCQEEGFEGGQELLSFLLLIGTSPCAVMRATGETKRCRCAPPEMASGTPPPPRFGSRHVRLIALEKRIHQGVGFRRENVGGSPASPLSSRVGQVASTSRSLPRARNNTPCWMLEGAKSIVVFQRETSLRENRVRQASTKVTSPAPLLPSSAHRSAKKGGEARGRRKDKGEEEGRGRPPCDLEGARASCRSEA
ncbi:hypothetical protein KM043_002125 [Ampulex compressa]|nr:hypothetical protein KM043_002125 [Ampulex compressa]